MTLLTAFRQLYVTDITVNEAILLEIQFRGGLNPFVKESHQIFNFVSQSLILEGILVSESGKNLSLKTLLLGMLFTGGTMLILRVRAAQLKMRN